MEGTAVCSKGSVTECAVPVLVFSTVTLSPSSPVVHNVSAKIVPAEGLTVYLDLK